MDLYVNSVRKDFCLAHHPISILHAAKILKDSNSKILIVLNNSRELLGAITPCEIANSLADKIKPEEQVLYSKDFVKLYSLEFEEIPVAKYYFFIDTRGNVTGWNDYEGINKFRLAAKNSFIRGAVENARIGMLAIDTAGRIQLINKRAREIAELDLSTSVGRNFTDLYDDSSILDILKTKKEQLNRSYVFDNVKLMINRTPFFDQKDDLLGVVSTYEDQNVLEKMALNLGYVKNLNQDLEAIVDSIYDEVIVVGSDGTILRASNKKTPSIWGTDLPSLVGKSIFDIERANKMNTSVTSLVLQKKKKISVMQEHKGRKYLSVGNPVLDDSGKVQKIVLATRDITEVKELKEKLQQTKMLTERYKKEVEKVKSSDLHIIYRSETMQELMIKVQRIATVDSTVTIYGESGVGKELIANAIHVYSNRKGQPFIKVNCGAIPENLLESELFGYEKGAFTGASEHGKKGFFELSHNGTLFLDEIGELPLSLQVKLLRVLQDREITRVGGTKPVVVNVRVICATNKDLEDMVVNSKFREDLFYRLHIIPLYVPPLRNRIEDIEPLSHYFIDKFNKKYNRRMHFSEDAMELLHTYHWPGNVRQLQNIIERAIVMSNTDLISANQLNDIVFERSRVSTKKSPVLISSIMPLKKATDELEKQLITIALTKHKSLTRVAEVLEVSQPTISRKVKAHKISFNE